MIRATIALAALVSSVVAFIPSSSIRSSKRFASTDEVPKVVQEDSAFEASDFQIDMDKLAQESAQEAAAAPKFMTETPNIVRKAPRQAGWFPLLLAPQQLDGSLAGDVGFDPLNLSEGRGRLSFMREAEVKHARLAMLGAAGWPLSELWHREIASLLGLDSILASEDRAPSVLNGGLQNEWILGVAAFTIIVGGVLELKAMEMSKKVGHKPGDYGFDPIGFYPIRAAFWIDRIAENLTREEKIVKAKFAMETAEIKNGRVAMLGITGMCLQEFISGIPVVQQTPFFFGDPII